MLIPKESMSELTPETLYDFLLTTYKNKQQAKTVMFTEHPFNSNITCGCTILVDIAGSDSVQLTYLADDENDRYTANITIAPEDKCRQALNVFVANVKGKLEGAILKQKSYEFYQFDWLMTHGFTLMDVYMGMKSASSYADFIKMGFAGHELFACREEFLNNEFKDTYFMKELLKGQPNAEQLMHAYRHVTGYSLDSVPEFEVTTTAGTLKAYTCDVPNNPGIIVMLQPEGYDDTIDVAAALVYETPDITPIGTPGEERNITSKDVRITIWGDAKTEDYTQAEIIRREDIEYGLSTETPDSQLM